MRSPRRSRWASSRCAGSRRAWRASSPPKGIHVAHFVIDGGIRQPGDARAERGADGFLDPDAIAQTYLQIHDQPRSAWTWEVELRPWTETF